MKSIMIDYHSKYALIFNLIFMSVWIVLAAYGAQDQVEKSDPNGIIACPMGDAKAPVRLTPIKPIYPEKAKNAGVEGIVVIQILLSKSGAVESAEVLKGQPMGLTEAALEAVKDLKFKPATKIATGEPIPCYFTVSIQFTLDEKDRKKAVDTKQNPTLTPKKTKHPSVPEKAQTHSFFIPWTLIVFGISICACACLLFARLYYRKKMRSRVSDN